MNYSNEMKIEVPYAYESPLPGLIHEFHKRLVQEEEETLTQDVIEILESKGYTVTKNE